MIAERFRLLLSARLWLPLATLVFTLLFAPFTQLDGLRLMPGDLVDARLNNYFLENIYQVLTGRMDSLWHLSFFAPFPYVLGFSDNHFGSSLTYIIARLIGIKPDTAFQFWFVIGYVVNFLAAYYALQRLNASTTAATIGALIFAFALPTAAHAAHAQLHYRFGLPLAITFLSIFLESKSWRLFLISGIWLVWQFYSGIYIGFFTLLLMGAMIIAYLGYAIFGLRTPTNNVFNQFKKSWKSNSKRQQIAFIAGILALLVLLIWLFYPYLQVSRLYGAKRSWSEISIMLPRPQSYFLSDRSFLWSSQNSRVFIDLPMRHEHQMFIGLAPLALVLAGIFMGSRSANGNTYVHMTGMLGIVIIMTLYVGGFSLWYLVHKLPLFSAIRAVSRVDVALLFPVAYLAAVAVDHLKNRLLWGEKAAVIFFLPMVFLEVGLTSMPTSSKAEWRQRIVVAEARIPASLPDESVLFLAEHSSEKPYLDELDAMWASLNRGLRTLNGYSGLTPPNYRYHYGRDCSEWPRRILSFLESSGQNTSLEAYRDLMSHIVPIDFIGCNKEWLKTPPSISRSNRVYTAEEFSQLSFTNIELHRENELEVVRVTISNPLDINFSSLSITDNTIRLSWRFIDSRGNPMSGWDPRKNLPFDIPAHGSLTVDIPLSFGNEREPMVMQLSLVQELVFWGHDVGIAPISIKIK